MPPKDAIHSTDATTSLRALERRARRWFKRFDPPDATTPLSTPTDESAKSTPSTPDRDSSLSLAKAREAALESIPAWMDKKQTTSTMSKRKKRTTLEMNWDNFEKGAIDTYYQNRYKNAWKAATTEYNTNTKGGRTRLGMALVQRRSQRDTTRIICRRPTTGRLIRLV